jgi:hypothetical protein
VTSTATGAGGFDRDIAAAQPAAYLETVQSRKHHVEHYDVSGSVGKVAERRLGAPMS